MLNQTKKKKENICMYNVVYTHLARIIVIHIGVKQWKLEISKFHDKIFFLLEK